MDGDVTEAEERKQREDAAGVLAGVLVEQQASASSLSSNATAFCIASLLGGASDRRVDVGCLGAATTHHDADVSEQDNEDATSSESKLTGDSQHVFQ